MTTFSDLEHLAAQNKLSPAAVLTLRVGRGFYPPTTFPWAPGPCIPGKRQASGLRTHSLSVPPEEAFGLFPSLSLSLCLCLTVLTEFSIKDRRKWATGFPQGRQVCWCASLLVLIFNTLDLLSQPKFEAFLNKQQLAAEVHSRKERSRKDRSGMWVNQIV